MLQCRKNLRLVNSWRECQVCEVRQVHCYGNGDDTYQSDAAWTELESAVVVPHHLRPYLDAPLRCGAAPARLGGESWGENRTFLCKNVWNLRLLLPKEL